MMDGGFWSSSPPPPGPSNSKCVALPCLRISCKLRISVFHFFKSIKLFLKDEKKRRFCLACTVLPRGDLSLRCYFEIIFSEMNYLITG